MRLLPPSRQRLMRIWSLVYSVGRRVTSTPFLRVHTVEPYTPGAVFLTAEALSLDASMNSEAISSPSRGFTSEAFTSATMSSICCSVGVTLPSLPAPLKSITMLSSVRSWPRIWLTTLALSWPRRASSICFSVSGSMKGLLSKKLFSMRRMNSGFLRVEAFSTAASLSATIWALARSNSASVMP